jgi:hypothetical protein
LLGVQEFGCGESEIAEISARITQNYQIISLLDFSRREICFYGVLVMDRHELVITKPARKLEIF